MWNDAIEISFKEIKRMVSVDKMLSYLYWKIPFTVHTDSSDKKLGAFIGDSNKTITFFSIIFIKPQHN